MLCGGERYRLIYYAMTLQHNTKRYVKHALKNVCISNYSFLNESSHIKKERFGLSDDLEGNTHTQPLNNCD